MRSVLFDRPPENPRRFVRFFFPWTGQVSRLRQRTTGSGPAYVTWRVKDEREETQ